MVKGNYMKTSLKLLLMSGLMLVGMTQFAAAVDDTTDSTAAQSRGAAAKALRIDAAGKAKVTAMSVEDRKAAIEERIAAKKQSLNKGKCERNQERITRMLSTNSNGANTQVDVLDTMYARVAGFYEDKGLSIENYQELINAIESAKIEARNTLQVMQTTEVNVDCSAEGMGDQFALYKGAVDSTRSQIKEYRKSLVDLISAMKASTSTDNTTDSAATTEDTETTDTTEAE